MRFAPTAAYFLLCVWLLGGAANAADNSTALQWQALTRIDVEEAYNLLKDNHPGAVPEVGDKVFTDMLAAAHAKALDRAAKVEDIEGHNATLAAFANSTGDGHIWSHDVFQRQELTWAGIIAAKRGPDWVVGVDDPKITGTELSGARIVRCDGRSADELAHEVMPFHASTSNEAFLVLRAGWLLVDDGNPFVHRPANCVFDKAGKRLDLTLHWTKIARDKLIGHIWKAPVGEAGFGVRASGNGYWIAIQGLSAKAQPVLDAVKAEERKMHEAPYVVLDLRGNGGGDDAYGRRLAEELYGAGYVKAVLGPSGLAGGCREVFRASPENIAAFAEQAKRFRKEGDMAGAELYTDAVRRMKAASAAGHPLTGPLTCNATRPAATHMEPSLMRGKMFVLTDAACFSSCINVVGFFHKLGAIQIGEDTGSDTHYQEVREIVLPSGLSTFSTLQAIAPDAPRKVGPYAPRFIYAGDIADTAALEKWVPGLATKN